MTTERIEIRDRRSAGRNYSVTRRRAIVDSLAFIAAPLRRTGCPPGEARAFATIVLAGFRGFMLDYCATRDRRRIDRAVDLWLKSLDAIPMSRERRP